jgi:translation initiation factor 3 subunit D
LLADVGSIKIGYVSRHQPKDPNNHVILGVQSFRPRELATLTGVNPNNGWAVLHRILSILTKVRPAALRGTALMLLLQQRDGQYVILKQPAKQTLSFYALPAPSAPGEVKKDA